MRHIINGLRRHPISIPPRVVTGVVTLFSLFPSVSRCFDLPSALKLQIVSVRPNARAVGLYAAQAFFCLTCGKVSLADAERLDEDASVKELLGLQKCPDQSALGQWLRQAGAAGGVEALRQNQPGVCRLLRKILFSCRRSSCFPELGRG